MANPLSTSFLNLSFGLDCFFVFLSFVVVVVALLLSKRQLRLNNWLRYSLNSQKINVSAMPCIANSAWVYLSLAQTAALT